MPRGRKAEPKTLEQRIEQLESEISSHKDAIKNLTAKLKEAKEAKRKADTELLLDAIAAKGLTIDDVLAAIHQDTTNPDSE